jgi:chemotaxis protein MotB
VAAGGDDDVWLISYADLMTLLFGFFVLMYTFASQDDSDQWERVRKEFAQHFGGAYVNPYNELAEEIKKVSSETEFLDRIEVKETEDGLVITFQSTVLFRSGQAEISPAAMKPMNILVNIVSEKIKELGVKMYIEGHTDDNPINTLRFPSNWELSAARATSVLRLFEENGVRQKKMQAVAYGQSRPLVPNRDEAGVPIIDNQDKNRRVVIRIVSSLAESMEQQAVKVKENTETEQKSE